MADQEHVFDYEAHDTGVSYCRHPDHKAGYSATCWKASANAAGWVPPEVHRAGMADNLLAEVQAAHGSTLMVLQETRWQLARIRETWRRARIGFGSSIPKDVVNAMEEVLKDG